MIAQILEEELAKENIFQNEEILLNSFIPEKLLFRERELRELTQYFRGFFLNSHNFHQNVLILGANGTGKTVIARKFGESFQKIASNKGNQLKYIHVNCRKISSPYLILLEIIHRINPHFPSRGFSTQELAQYLLKAIEEKKVHLLVCFDEIKFAVNKKGSSDLFYWFTRSGDDSVTANSRISFIMISEDINFLERFDENIKNTLIRNIIFLSVYSCDEVKKIIEQRVNLAFAQKAVNPKVIEYIAEIGANKKNIRYSIELLQGAGKIANLHNEILSEKHVNHAREIFFDEKKKEMLNDLKLHKKLVLLALAQCVAKSNGDYVPIFLIMQKYFNLCKKLSQKPRKRTQIWHYIQELINKRFIKLRMENENIRGRRAIFNLNEIPLEMLISDLVLLIDNK